MLAAFFRRTSLKKLHTVTAILVFVWYIIQFQLPKLLLKPPTSRCARLDWPHFPLEQNGEYWIHNNFISSISRDLKSNTGITLTTHGSWSDIKYTGRLAARWNAPISMAVYVRHNELQDVYEAIHQIRYCSKFGAIWKRWVSMQLVFSNNYFPRQLSHFDHEYRWGFNCNISTNFPNISMPIDYQKMGVSMYPINMLRNVARLNAHTYFVLPLDPSMFPTFGFVNKFLDFINTQKIQDPFKR